MPDAALSPAEQAEVNQLHGQLFSKSTALNPIKDFSAQELADLSAQDPSYNLVENFRNQKESWGDPATVQKVADAHNLLKQRGFKASDLPGPKQIAGTVYDVSKGLVKQAWNYANAGAASVAGAIFGGEAEKEMNQDAQRRIAENFSGTEQAVTGLGNLAQQGVEKAGQLTEKISRKLGGTSTTKLFSEYSPEDKINDLWDAVGKGDVKSDIARGHGAFMQGVGGNVVSELEQAGKPIRPEQTEQLAAGDPFSFAAFGGAMKGAGAIVPQAVRSAVESTASAAGQGLAQTGGKAIQAAGSVMNAGGKALEGVGGLVKTVGPIVEAAHAIATGDASRALSGVGEYYGGSALKWTGKKAQELSAGVKNFGKQVSGEAGIPVGKLGSAAQLTKDVLESAHPAALSLVEGAITDLGVAAATSENPSDTNSIGLGTAIGALGGAKRIAGHALSGQIIAPRIWGSSTAIPSSGKLPALDAMHATALRNAAPGVRARMNAVREFTAGAAPNTDVFLASDPESLKTSLIASGVPESSAAQFSQTEGTFIKDLPDKNGFLRRVIIVNNPDAAPHEAFHAVQDVLGEAGNQHIDELVKQQYANQWDAEGQRYASRLTGEPSGANWRDSLLDASGWGRSEAIEKLYHQIDVQTAAETGAKPDPNFIKQRVAGEWNSALDKARQNNPQASTAELESKAWRDILSPEEVTKIGDKYIARELAAENFDAVFKHKAAPSWALNTVARLVQLLGGNNPLADRRSQIGKVEPKFDVVNEVRKEIQPATVEPKAAPKLTPVGVKPSPVAPVEKVDSTEADKAKELADAAPDAPLAGGTRSARELLGHIAEAIAQRVGVKINYLSAPNEPAAATTSNRETRRAIIEAHRALPPEARALWEKNFFPDRVTKTKTGYQVQGWAPEVFASNAHKMASFLADLNPTLSPYEIDPTTKSFTAAAWESLYSDVQKFVKNQVGGRTGAGAPLAVPEFVRERGYYAPEVKGTPAPIEQGRADFINLLFNFRLPDTARMQKGKLPLNIAGQEVSTATEPGRVEIPIRPRGEYTGAEAELQGIEGRSIKETNPLRNEIESAAQKAGKPLPSFIEAIQKLNLENIKEVEVAPEQPEFRGNTLTLTAGFQPKLAEEPEAIRRAAIRVPSGKVYVAGDDNFTHYEALRRAHEAGENVEKPAGPDALKSVETGFVTNAGEFLDRKAAFKRAKEYGQITGDEWTPKKGHLESVTLDGASRAQFQPKPVEEMAPDEFRKWAAEQKGGFTRTAYDFGKAADSQEAVDAMRVNADKLNARAMEMLKAGKMDDAMSVVGQGQFFNEAWQYATGEGSGGESAKKEGFTPKFSSSKGVDKTAKIEDNVPVIKQRLNSQSQPPVSSEDVRKVAEDYAKRAGIAYAPAGGSFAPVNEDLAKRLADHYESAKHDPDNAEVQKSYAALADETVQQYHEMTRAGFHAEPWTGTGEPYKSSAEMVNDVRSNKHLFYLPSKEAFGHGEESKSNPMLADSGVELNGERVSVNDLFRAVHDFFGHAKEGFQFGPRGEFNAWREHSEMFSPEAQGALAAETLAQNSWVNYGKHLRDTSGKIAAKGEAGYVAPAARPFAEQKNTVIPKAMIDEARAQFQPKDDEFKFPDKAPGGFKKVWLLPDGKPVQLGGEWHHQWLAANPDVAEKFGIKDVPPFEGSDAAGVREDALKKGFARVNYQLNSGTLTVEARASDWRKQKESVRKLVEENAGDIDNVRVHLTDDAGVNSVRSGSAKLFNFDDAEKLNHIPLMDADVTPRREDSIAESETLRPDTSYNASENYFKTQAQPRKQDFEWSDFARLLDPEALIPPADANDKSYGALTFSALKDRGIKSLDFLSNGSHHDAQTHLRAYTDGTGEFPATEEGLKAAYKAGRQFEDDAFQSAYGADRWDGLKSQAQPKREEELSLPGMEHKSALSSKEVADMTKEELADHFPEAVMPRKRDQLINSEITNSPLYKQAGDEESAVKHFADKMVSFAKEWESDPAYAAGKEWYSKFVPKLKKLFGADAQLMAELLAATSPQTNVTTNFAYAYDALEGFRAGRFDKLTKKFEQGLAMLENDTWQGWYGKEAKAGRTLEGESEPTPARFLEHWIDTHDLKPTQSNGKLYGQHSLPVLQVLARRWLDYNKGPKVANFVKNLLGTGHEATIDLWADRTMRRLGYEGSKERWRILPQNQAGVSEPDFHFAQKVFRRAANELKMEADDLQGALWFAEKSLWSQRGWGRLDLGDFQKEMDKVPMLKAGIKQRSEIRSAQQKVAAAQEQYLDLISPRDVR